MKQFKNEATTMLVDGLTEKKHDYKSLAILCLQNVNPKEGIRADEMYKNFKVIDKIESQSEEIKLEDAEHSLLLQKVTQMSWAGMHKDIVAFTEAIRGAKEV